MARTTCTHVKNKVPWSQNVRAIDILLVLAFADELSIESRQRKWCFRVIVDEQSGKKALMPYANSEGLDERAHPCSFPYISKFLLVWSLTTQSTLLRLCRAGKFT